MLKSRKSGGGFLVAALVAVGLTAGAPVCRAGDVAYTKYHIHLQEEVSRKGEKSYQASYSGWVAPGAGHALLPAGSAVKYDAGGKAFRKGFTLIVQDPAKAGLGNDKIFFEFDSKRMGMGEDEYARMITSPSPVALDGFSAKDREGIKDGKAYRGMTKLGVMTALGYPAAHKTPNPDKDGSWTFWKDRFRTLVVEFNSQGIVEAVRE